MDDDVKSLESLKAEVLKVLNDAQKSSVSALAKMPRAGSSARESAWKEYNRIRGLEALLREACEHLSN